MVMGGMDSGNSGSLQSSSTGGGGCGGDGGAVGGGGGGRDEQEFESSQGHRSGLFNPTSLCMPSFVDTVQFQLNSLPTGSQFNGFDPNFMINYKNHINGDDNDNNSVDKGWPNKFGSLAQTTPMSISSPSFLDDTNCTTGLVSAFINNYQYDDTGLRSSRVRPASDHPGRNPKKRSRATRKAPTTVLTTDTNNFRQMVQEFTGIPSPPFTTFPDRTRLDLFGGLGIQLPNNGHGHKYKHGHEFSSSSSPPPYLLTPIPQKIVPSSLPKPIPVRPFSSDSLNPELTFQSLIQHPLSYDLGSVETKATGSLLNQFASAHTTTTTAAATTPPPVTTTMTGSTVLEHDRLGECSENGSYIMDRIGANAVMTVNSTGHGGVARSEGMVDTWICSSD